MKAYDIIAYTYDADIHCEACADKQFGKKLYNEKNPPTDSEGNEVHPVFASDEITDDTCCGTCHCIILDNL